MERVTSRATLATSSPEYETGGYFHEWNRNKRSAVINMDDADGRALMHELIRRSDVLINNYSARVLPKWGLDWAALQAINPRLVLVTMPAFGSQGPYREFVGYGETLEGAGGLARLSGYEAGQTCSLWRRLSRSAGRPLRRSCRPARPAAS